MKFEIQLVESVNVSFPGPLSLYKVSATLSTTQKDSIHTCESIYSFAEAFYALSPKRNFQLKKSFKEEDILALFSVISHLVSTEIANPQYASAFQELFQFLKLSKLETFLFSSDFEGLEFLLNRSEAHVPFLKHTAAALGEEAVRNLDAVYNADNTERDSFGHTWEDISAFRENSAFHEIRCTYKYPLCEWKLLVLVNPFSGTKKGRRVWEELVRPVFSALSLSYSVKETEYASHATEIGRDITRQQYDLIVCIGGDGLLYELINGMCATGKALRTPLTVVPSGSGNGLALSLGRKTALEAVLRLLDGSCERLDLVECYQRSTGSRSFSFISQSWGILPEIDLMSEYLRCIGDLRFTVVAVQKILRGAQYHGNLYIKRDVSGSSKENSTESTALLRDFGIENPDEWVRIPGPFNVLIAVNIPWLSADTIVSPEVRWDDGEIHIVYTKDLGRCTLMNLFMKMETGAHVKSKGVELLKVKEFLIEPSSGKFTGDCDSYDIDGERFGDSKQAIHCILRPGKAVVFN